MKHINVRKIGALFIVMLLFNIGFVPAVSCETNFKSHSSNITIEKMELPEIEIIKMTNTSSIVQVGDIVLSMESDSAYTEARMTIKDQNTSEVADISYKVFEVDGGFETKVYCGGQLYSTLITEYNPIKPIELNTEFSEQSYKISEVASKATKFQWDGVTFVQGSGIKYPHPDRDYYGIETWEDYRITGNNLFHCHIDENDSDTYSKFSPIIVGGVIGVMLTVNGSNVVTGVGGIVGTLLGLIMGNDSAALLLDEEGCIWYWYGQESFWKTSSYGSVSTASIIIPSPTLYQVPAYVRIAEYTLWNTINLLDPDADDWNPWNDPDSSSGSLITTGELQESIHCWLSDIPTPGAGGEVTTSRLQYLISCWLNDESCSMSSVSETLVLTSTPSINANRTISNYNVTPNSTFTVNVEITTDQEITSLALEENYPLLDGTAVELTNETFRFWNVTAIECDNSNFRSWKTGFVWSSTISGNESRTVTYNVTVPVNLTGGIYNISGNVSAYEVSATEVSGDSEVYVMDDWNPWNDWDSENGRYISNDEILDAIYYWQNYLAIPQTNHIISSDEIMDIVYYWQNNYPM